MDAVSISETTKKVKTYKGSAGAAKRVMDMPRKCFGSQRGWRARREVLIALALSADPNGTNGYPGYSLIAQRAKMSERNARRCLRWFEEHGLLSIFPYAGPKHTHRYIIRFPEKDSGTENPDSIVSESTRTISTCNPDNKTPQPGQLASEPGQYSVRQPSFDRPINQREGPENLTASPLPSRTPARKTPCPENGQDPPRNVFASLAMDYSTSWIIPIPELQRAVENAFGEGFSQQEIVRALINTETDENDGQSWRLRKLAYALPSRLDSIREKEGINARNDEAVRIQVEAKRRQAEEDAKNRQDEESGAEQAAQEILARLRGGSASVAAVSHGVAA